MAQSRSRVGIEQRKDARGRAQYRPSVTHPTDRNRKVRGPWTYSLAEAKAWRTRALAKKVDGQLAVDPERVMPSVVDAADAFLEGIESAAILSRKREPYAPKTVRDYRAAFRDWITPELGAVAIDKLRRSEVQRFIDQLATLREGATVRNIVHALCALYTYLLPRHDELGHDPTSGLILPRAGGPRERYADTDEMAALLAALPHDLAVPYAIAFFAGLRKAEIQSLPVDRVDLEAGWLDVAYGLDHVAGFKGPKTYAGVRSVPIFESLRPYLERQVAIVRERVGKIVASTEERPGTLLLPSAHGSRFGHREMGSPFKRQTMGAWGWKRDGGAWVKSRLDVLQPIGLHEGRHSFGTAAIRAGYDVKTVQEWMGHAHASTTLDIYAKRRGRVGSSRVLATRMNRYLLGDAESLAA